MNYFRIAKLMGSQKTKEQGESGPLCLSNSKLEAKRLTHLRKGKSMLKSAPNHGF